MEDETEEYLHLIAKHLRSETTDFEKKRLAHWLNENDEHNAIYEQVAYIWQAGKTPQVQTIPDVEAAWNKVRERTGVSEKNASGTGETKIRSLYDVRVYMKVAASLLILIGLFFGIKAMWFNKNDTSLSAGDHRQKFNLPDGSVVWLNKDTRLTYSDSYNKSERQISLDGEAFFEVKKDKNKPFIVVGRHSTTKVLGTSFNVKSTGSNESDKIEVVTGKVSFATESEKKKVILLPGDKATANPDGEIAKMRTEGQNFLAWKSDKLSYDNTPLQEVVLSMEEYFDVNVRIENEELLDCRFTGTFTKPEIEEMLKVLSASIDLSYDKKDKTYLFTGKGCK